MPDDAGDAAAAAPTTAVLERTSIPAEVLAGAPMVSALLSTEAVAGEEVTGGREIWVGGRRLVRALAVAAGVAPGVGFGDAVAALEPRLAACFGATVDAETTKQTLAAIVPLAQGLPEALLALLLAVAEAVAETEEEDAERTPIAFLTAAATVSARSNRTIHFFLSEQNRTEHL